MYDIHLSERITALDLTRLAMDLGVANGQDEVNVNFGSLRYFEIIPMTLLLGKLIGWYLEGKKVTVSVPDSCRAKPYLQRMDFFRKIGVDIHEDFKRQPSAGRFREFEVISRGSESQADRLATQVADVIVPDQKDSEDYSNTGYYDCVEYAVSELVLNTIQHSSSAGFLGAQFYVAKGYTQIGVIDNGKGIRQSFIDKNSPHSNRIANDADAISVALERKVSSTTHSGMTGEAVNSGVGLTILAELAGKAGGHYTVLSGAAAVIDGRVVDLGSYRGFSGTLSAFIFPREPMNKFSDHLEKAKQKIVDVDADRFEGAFL